MIIAIDGPAGAGKSTTARRVAERLGFAYINTGAMYRAVALAAQQQGLRLPEDEGRLAGLAQGLSIAISDHGSRLHLDGVEVTESLRRPDISELSSQIAAVAGVRRALVVLQQKLARQGEMQCGGAVLEGRDIQTVVCPDAEVKIFLTASTPVRAQRRLEQWRQEGHAGTADQAEQEVTVRDERDSSRDVAPLRPAEDALILDTDQMSEDEVVEAICRTARKE